MRKGQIGSSIFLLFIGIFFFIEAQKFPIGRLTRPGPGFLPFWLGISMMIVSLALVIRSILKKDDSLPHENLWKGLKWHKIILTTIALLLYALVLESIGFSISTFVLIFFLFCVIGEMSWWGGAIGSILTSFLTYALFRQWLEVQLPKGLWGL
jgi:putative tricarboxylic transport membrane protein